MDQCQFELVGTTLAGGRSSANVALQRNLRADQTLDQIRRALARADDRGRQISEIMRHTVRQLARCSIETTG